LIFGVRGARETIQKYGGRSPPHFGMVFGAAGAAQTPKIDDFRPAQKSCIKNPSVCFCLLKRPPRVAWTLAATMWLKDSRCRAAVPRERVRPGKNWPALSDGRTGEGVVGRFPTVLIVFGMFCSFLMILLLFLWFSNFSGRSGGDGRMGEPTPQSTSQKRICAAGAARSLRGGLGVGCRLVIAFGRPEGRF
jgi:hypothetical protein